MVRSEKMNPGLLFFSVRLFLISLLSALPCVLFSQTAETGKDHRFSIGLTISPDYCYRVLKADEPVKFVAEMRDTMEIPKIGYTFGVGVTMRISRRITLESGLLFSNKGEKMKKFRVIVSNPSGLRVPGSISQSYRYYYLDVPVKVNYNFLLKRTKLYVTAGISPDFFLVQKTRSIAEYADGSDSKKTTTSSYGYSFVNIAVLAGIGFSYDLSDRFLLKIEPVYRRSVTSISDTPVKGYFYSFGLTAGFFIRL